MQVTGFLIGVALGIVVLAASLLLIRLAAGVYRGKKAGASHALMASIRPTTSDAERNAVSSASLFIGMNDGSMSRFDLTASSVHMGRAQDNDLVVTTDVLAWDTVSRHHARIYFSARVSRWVVEDKGSRNGVYVNGVRTGHNVLKDGMRLAFGGVPAVFREVG